MMGYNPIVCSGCVVKLLFHANVQSNMSTVLHGNSIFQSNSPQLLVCLFYVCTSHQTPKLSISKNYEYHTF